MKIKNMSRDVLKGECILIIVSLLWGSSFLFQKKGMDYVGPFTLGACRFLLGALILLPIVIISSKKKKKVTKSLKFLISISHLFQLTLLQKILNFLAFLDCHLVDLVLMWKSKHSLI